jgi:hypothetical protein
MDDEREGAKMRDVVILKKSQAPLQVFIGKNQK